MVRGWRGHFEVNGRCRQSVNLDISSKYRATNCLLSAGCCATNKDNEADAMTNTAEKPKAGVRAKVFQPFRAIKSIRGRLFT